MGLSVIIITKNEALNLADCLRSVAWADERIIVDSGSSDATVSIAQEHGAQVVLNPVWPGFGPQKQIALNHATQDWVLSLDADERITSALQAEIQAAMTQADAPVGYEIPRLSYFCGQPVRHCGWTPDYVLRLFRRNAARFSDDLVHEKVLLNGHSARLAHSMTHYSYRTQEDVARKIEHYSSAAAQQMFAKGKRSSALAAQLRGAWAFVRTFVIKLGFLDGATGWQVAQMNAATTRLKYLKLCALQRTAR